MKDTWLQGEIQSFITKSAAAGFNPLGMLAIFTGEPQETKFSWEKRKTKNPGWKKTGKLQVCLTTYSTALSGQRVLLNQQVRQQENTHGKSLEAT